MQARLTAGFCGPANPFTLKITCPLCGHKGTFDTLGVEDRHIDGNMFVGLRKCPSDVCHAVVFFARMGPTGQVVVTFPHLRIDFDKTDLPEGVLKAIEEAVTCHASGCYIAAGIMIRKTLEELCHDKGAKGIDLYKRVEALGKAIIVPPELITGLQNIRLLGNDAAHIESQVYNQVGKDEVEIAIDCTKEILKAVYQYSALMARLESFKAASQPTS